MHVPVSMAVQFGPHFCQHWLRLVLNFGKVVVGEEVEARNSTIKFLL